LVPLLVSPDLAQQTLRLPSGAVLHRSRAASSVSPMPLLFLHGVGGGAWSWGPQRAALAGEFDCFVWEGRGHGAAPRIADAGLSDYYLDALEGLRQVVACTGQPALVVGHSMGGLLALALACEQGAAVRGLFLVDPVYADRGDPPVTFPRPVLAVIRLVVGVLARSYLEDGRLSRALSRLIFRVAFQDRAAMERAWPLQRTQVPLEYPRMLYESFEGVTGFPFHPFADRVEAPVHLVEATARASSRRSRFAEVMARLRARLGPAATFEALQGGHYLQLDRPAQISDRLARFARQLPPAMARAPAPATLAPVPPPRR
jgi:pimeloyl-ACP methyl ester carboxylesterase